MNYYPNEKCMLEFCENVFPLLREKFSDIKLCIVGSNPTGKILALNKIEGVEVTGRVADVRPYVQQAALTVVPLTIARGTQNKILESMSMGVPVVCSPVAARGIDAVPEQHVLVADSPEDYVRQIGRIIEHKDERNRLAEAGRNRMLSHHSWSIAMEKMDVNISSELKDSHGLSEVTIQENSI